jgi:hypothetical protein
MATVNITVYLQALGGKFLGPHAYNNTGIDIHLTLGGSSYKFSYDAASSSIDDGMISQTFSNGSPYALPILTLQDSRYQTNYLTIDSNTVCGTIQIQVPDGAFVPATITAHIPRPTGLTLTVAEQVLLVPQQTDYTFIIPVPGLLLELNTPTATDDITVASLSILVKMMCGCEISVGKPTSFWSPDDFEVIAHVTFTDNSARSYPMQFDSRPDSNDSAFFAFFVTQSQIASVYFTAQQYSTGNFGYLQL